MSDEIIKNYQEISEYEYRFPGVSFESALDKLVKLSVPNVYMYEDILYSNNALLLGILYDVLSSEKIVEEVENGVASITFILEQYIKKTIKKNFNGNLICKAKEVWEDIKKIAKWMYNKSRKNIDENSLLSIIKSGDNFIELMMQMAFMDYMVTEDGRYYFFIIDSLTDFLIARSLFNDISGRNYNEQVEIIKDKSNSLYNLKEALIIAIFDNMSPDYKRIRKIMEDTGLINNLNADILVKIHFKSENINDFL